MSEEEDRYPNQLQARIAELTFCIPWGWQDYKLQEKMRNRERIKISVRDDSYQMKAQEFEIVSRVEVDGMVRYTIQPSGLAVDAYL